MPVAEAAKAHTENGTNGCLEEDELLAGVHVPALRGVLEVVRARDPHQNEFLQAVKEVAVSLQPVFESDPAYVRAFEQMCEPERQVMFRVAWVDDKGNTRINRGWRVQFSSAIGPYKGGLRFHPSVNLSVIKFLGFEQIFKNALTTLPMGGGKGGSDFDPKASLGKSDSEIVKFCQAFMTALYRHIGSNVDVPAGDIGVGKGLAWGGSNIRPEATGYGAVFFAQNALEDRGEALEGKRCVVTGSGNVAQYSAEQLLQQGAVVLAMSDSRGYIYEPDGMRMEHVQQVMKIKSRHDGRLEQYDSASGSYVAGRKPWEIDASYDLAFPCATQNEVDLEEAKLLCSKGCKALFEGANMPCTPRAIKQLNNCGVLYCPSKATNAGGVAVSGLEITQQRIGVQWSREEVSEKLRDIMAAIYSSVKAAAEEYGVDLATGANIAAFKKARKACVVVAEAVIAQGPV
eukprot:scaffold12.g8188.t1